MQTIYKKFDILKLDKILKLIVSMTNTLVVQLIRQNLTTLLRCNTVKICKKYWTAKKL